MSNDDCCDFGACFGSSSDAQAHGVLQGESPTSASGVNNTRAVSDYGSVNSDSIDIRPHMDSQANANA